MIDIDTDTYIGSPPRGGGSGETRIVERTVSLYRLRMQVVHLVDSAQGIIDAIDEAESESNPRVRFAYEEDVLGNYWDYLGIPELIEEADDDGDTGYWPNGVPLYLSIVSPSDFPSPIEVWFQNWSDANNRPFANLEPTTRKTDFANYDGATYSAYTVNITQRATDQTRASNSGLGTAPLTGYVPTQAQWKAGGNFQFYMVMNEVQFDFTAA